MASYCCCCCICYFITYKSQRFGVDLKVHEPLWKSRCFMMINRHGRWHLLRLFDTSLLSRPFWWTESRVASTCACDDRRRGTVWLVRRIVGFRSDAVIVTIVVILSHRVTALPWWCRSDTYVCLYITEEYVEVCARVCVCVRAGDGAGACAWRRSSRLVRRGNDFSLQSQTLDLGLMSFA